MFCDGQAANGNLDKLSSYDVPLQSSTTSHQYLSLSLCICSVIFWYTKFSALGDKNCQIGCTPFEFITWKKVWERVLICWNTQKNSVWCIFSLVKKVPSKTSEIEMINAHVRCNLVRSRFCLTYAWRHLLRVSKRFDWLSLFLAVGCASISILKSNNESLSWHCQWDLSWTFEGLAVKSSTVNSNWRLTKQLPHLLHRNVKSAIERMYCLHKHFSVYRSRFPRT